ncbi:MAG: hypothetical protein WCF18_23390 [Chthoniobacteraceae bacterium]
MKTLLMLVLVVCSAVCARGDTAIGTAISKIPYVITKPGKYRLAKSLTLTTGTTAGIVVKASQVVIDFNGYTLAATGLANIATNIAVDVQDADYVTIRNGTIVGFGMAISCLNNGVGKADALLVEDMTCDAQVDTGVLSAAMFLVGEQITVRRCRIMNSGTGETTSGGIYCQNSATIEDCSVSGLRSFNTTNLAAFRPGDGPGDGLYSIVLKNCSVSNLTTGGQKIGVRAGSDNTVVDGCSFYGLSQVFIPAGSGYITVKNSSIRASGSTPFTTFGNVKDGGNNTVAP